MQLNEVSGANFESLTQDIFEKGWSVQHNVLDAGLLLGLRAELAQLSDEGELMRAGVGRGDDFQLAADIRRDKIYWLDGTTSAQSLLFHEMEQLRLRLNQKLFLGLFEYEAHYACYGKGAFYQKHYDSFRGEANRLISTVLYLNPQWQEGDGGELLIYSPNDEGILLETVAPTFGTLACFLSEEVPHEVRISATNRYSIAGWFRCNSSIGGAINPPE